MESREQRKPAPHGVGGWLLLLVVLMLVIGPLLALKDISHVYYAEILDPRLTSSPQWMALRGWLSFLVFLAIAASIAGGLVLVFSRQRSAIDWVKGAIWLQPILGLVIVGSSYKLVGVDGTIQLSILLVVAVLYASVWHAYLNRSARVKATYAGATATPATTAKETPPQPDSPSVPLETSATPFAQHVATEIAPPEIYRPSIVIDSPASTTLPKEDAWYERALEELETGQPVKATWARSLAETNGDDAKAKSTYIRLRVLNFRSAYVEEQMAKVEAKRVALENAEQSAKAEPDASTTPEVEERVKATAIAAAEREEIDALRKSHNRLFWVFTTSIIVIFFAILLFGPLDN